MKMRYQKIFHIRKSLIKRRLKNKKQQKSYNEKEISAFPAPTCMVYKKYLPYLRISKIQPDAAGTSMDGMPGRRQGTKRLQGMWRIANIGFKAAYTCMTGAVLFWGTVSCRGPVELGAAFWETGDIAGNPGNTGEEGGAGEPVIRKTRYITGVEYPEGYNWLPDLGYSAEGAVLFLMRENERILELPIGYDSCISADADMHRCMDGHLYTDFSTDQETVVKKDGAEKFRFFGREMIVSLAERPEGIYTLGQPRSGTGWVYRLNGEIILYKGVGRILHGLHMDGDVLCFSYRDMIETSEGTENRYYIVRDGTPCSIPSTDDITLIEDAVSMDMETHYIARMQGIKGRVIFSGPDATALEMPSGATDISGCSFIMEEGRLFVFGTVYGGSGTGYGNSFWDGTSYMCSAGAEYKIYGYCIDDGQCYFVSRRPYDGSTVRIYRDGTAQSVAPAYDFIYGTAMGAHMGDCCVALSDANKGNRPMLWINDDLETFDFNGAFTSITYW